jgi:DNA-binding Lrp family transcriptional regulator
MLTELERTILGFLDEDPTQGLAALARRSHRHVGTVQRVILRLRERARLKIRPFINLLALGYHDVVVYANLAVDEPARQRRLVERIRRSEQVSWLSYLIGDHQLAFAFYCRHLSELGDFIAQLSAVNEASFSSWVVSPRLRYTQYNRKYLLPEGGKQRAYHFTTADPFLTIDNLDAEILWTLANTDAESNREVARALGAPPATVDRRLQQLRSSGVICGSIAMVPQEFLGVTVYRLLLTCRFLSQQLRAALEKFCLHHPTVIFLIESLGPYNFEIGVEVSRPQEIPVLAQEIQRVCGSALHDIQTYMEVEDLKWSFFPMKSAW